MKADRKPGLIASRVVFAATFVLSAAVFIEAVRIIRDNSIRTETIRWTLLTASWSVLLVVSAGLLMATWLPAGRRFLSAGSAMFSRLTGLRRLVIPGVLLAALVSPGLAYIPFSHPWDLFLTAYPARLFIFWSAAVGGAVLLQLREPGRPYLNDLAGLLVFYALLYRFSVFLPAVSTLPFSLGWSESSRYYYSSLFFAERIYGVDVNPTVLHPTRYMLQAVPFLFGNLPLWFHRAWQVGLWIAAHLAAGRLLAWRLSKAGRLTVSPALFTAWAALFLFQGPVWYHLLVMVIIVLWGMDSARFWRTLLIVGAASAWAGISRVNWIPLPAALAALIYLVEIPRENRPVWRYLAPPFSWGLAGVLLGLLSQWGYAVLSGNALEQFASSFSSDLLWYRLLPNTTYPPGILFGTLIVFLPLLFLVLDVYRGRWRDLDGWRWLGITGVLLVFLLGGLIVSVKIGGGSNLHNLDGFIALMLTAAAFLYFKPGGQARRGSPVLVSLVLAVPVAAALSVVSVPNRINRADAADDLHRLTKIVEAAAAEGGEVLFIAERQLLTFGEIEGVDLVEDYEKVFLMEMVMAGNRDYLDRLQQDLADHKFAVIVSDKVNLGLKSRDSAFSEENNVWDEEVNYFLLCHYEVVVRLDTAAADILKPRAVEDCPEIKEVTP